jgi:hypothetical protein
MSASTSQFEYAKSPETLSAVNAVSLTVSDSLEEKEGGHKQTAIITSTYRVMCVQWNHPDLHGSVT